jgi:hypothetical protein
MFPKKGKDEFYVDELFGGLEDSHWSLTVLF